MNRWMALAGAAFCALVPAVPAGASGDYGCDPAWKLASDSYGSCGNRAALAPGNDTRVNLFLLLREAQGAPAGKAAQIPAPDDRAGGQTFFSWSLLRQVWFAAPDPARGKRRGEAARAGVGFGPVAPDRAIADRRLVGIDRGGARDKGQG